MSSEHVQIGNLINQYYEGLFTCDVPLLQSVFHPKAQYYTRKNDDLLHYDMDEYFDVIRKRTPPSKQGEQRYLSVGSIDITGADTAMVKLNCHMMNTDYTDYLSLIRINERWQIVAKTFHATPIE
ncbi:nuclear transport factor 2 family protein [Sneathiella aquimaris]|uniref:nuclear transport factor 2 family protein n=1 Tax=Sneathiella aquimaris TaxID=2599305 RepID=UPI00146D7EB7|nr:nuclear transport factor 2 family protein [Sneathiella aquimaris]